MRSSRARKAAEWLMEHPEKSVAVAAAKFKIQKGAVYQARKKIEPAEVALNQPMIIHSNSGDMQSLVIIVKTSDPSSLLRELFQ